MNNTIYLSQALQLSASLTNNDVCEYLKLMGILDKNLMLVPRLIKHFSFICWNSGILLDAKSHETVFNQIERSKFRVV